MTTQTVEPTTVGWVKPAAATVAILTSIVLRDTIGTVLIAAGVAVAAWRIGARKPVRWLSVRDQTDTAATLLTIGAALLWALPLAALAAAPAARWKLRRANLPLRQHHRRIARKWATLAAEGGPVEGCQIRWATMQPQGTGWTARITLPSSKHPDDIVGNETVRRAIETRLAARTGSVTLTPTGSTSAVTITVQPPTDLAKMQPKPMPKPTTAQAMPVGTDTTGQQHTIDLTMPGGVRSALVIAPSGSGKSHCMRNIIRGLLALGETVICVDGGGGSSFAGLGIDVVPDQELTRSGVSEADQTRTVLTAAVAELTRREQLMAQLGTPDYTPKLGPVTTVVIDEAHIVKQWLGASQTLVTTLLNKGRKTGIRVIICTQSALERQMPGGAIEREKLIAVGAVIALRPDATTRELLPLGPAQTIQLDALPHTIKGVAAVCVGGQPGTVIQTHDVPTWETPKPAPTRTVPVSRCPGTPPIGARDEAGRDTGTPDPKPTVGEHKTDTQPTPLDQATAAVLSGHLSTRAAATHYGVSKSAIDRRKKRLQEQATP